MQDVNTLPNSSTLADDKTLAPKMLLRALQEFANTGDEPDRAAYFLKRWPGFLEGIVETLAKIHINVSDSPIGMMLLEIGGGGKPLDQFRELRGFARLAWKGNEAGIALLLHLGFEDGKSNLVLPDWRRSGFRYEPRTNFQSAVYELLKHSREARVCANPECASPYFIAHDPRRKFCSSECTAPFQKEWKRRWWERKGRLWRKARESKKSRQSRKGGKR